VHLWVAPGSEQVHVFSLGGMSFATDGLLSGSTLLESRAAAPWEGQTFRIAGGAGGFRGAVGDYFYGDQRRPFTDAGMWGLFRVLSDPSCPIRPLDGRVCG
jgi:manganese oxidase